LGRLNLGEHMNCTTCKAKLSPGTPFCGSCGARASKRRDSLTGLLFDGRYRIEAKLAMGGFGSIYRATYAPTGASVALKVLHPEFASDPVLSARFRREASVLASLRDPHTVKTYEHGQAADGTPYIAMELLTGRSLQAELRTQGPLPWWRMLAIMRGVCCSLIEAHALGIVHRDLKPANIHLEQRGSKSDFVKVLDFGIVKVLGGDGDDESDITRVGQAIGTLEYMSPEQIVGSETDHRTDFYTLGVVAYEMITGRRPFADATGPAGLMTALMTHAPVPPSTLFHKDCFPATVDRLILRCLSCDRQDRFATASELVEAIDEILVYAASPAPFAPSATLPGSGPFITRAPAARRNSLPSFAAVSIDDGELNSLDVTTVDVAPLVDFPWEPTLDRTHEPLARTPHLDTPPDPPSFKAARGSTVSVTPLPTEPAPQPTRFVALKLAAWAVALLASGIGLGMLVATLS
jgi:serine/threonine protein kinase